MRVQRIAHDFAWFAERLEPAEVKSDAAGARDWMTRCPVHGGSDSLHLTEAKDGKALVKCFGCGARYREVVTALEAESDGTRATESVVTTKPARRPAYSPAGDLVSYQDGGRWVPPLRLRGVSPSHLHGGLPTLADVPMDQPVVFAEGHGPAIALNAAGIPAVCSVTGKASAIDEVGASFLYGRKVILSPDFGGEGHMDACGEVIARVASEVLIAPEWPDGFPDNGDAADYIAAYGVDAMKDHYAAATPWAPAEDEGDESFIAEWASDVELVEPEPLLLGFLEPVDYTVLFGDGGTGKGVVAAQWVADLTSGRNLAEPWVVLLLDYEQNTVMEWAPRVKKFGGDLARLRVIQAAGAIWDHADRVRDEAQRASEAHGGASVYVVVDSIGYAIGDAKLEDSGTATKYKKALNDIGRPTLSLAHTTKQSADSARWPFGSIFWHNNVRHTISITKAGGDEDPRILSNKKANRRGEFAPVEVDWSWVRGDLPDRLDFSAATPKAASTMTRIATALANGPMTINEIVVALANDGGEAVNKGAVAQALGRATEFSSDGKKPARWSVFGASLMSRTSSEDLS